MFRALKKIFTHQLKIPVPIRSKNIITKNNRSIHLPIQRYYDELKPSSDFVQDITAIMHDADCYLSKRIIEYNQLVPTYKLGIVLDIDDTSLSHYHTFEKAKFSNPSIIDAYIAANAPAIYPVLKFYQKAISHGISTFFVTARKPLEHHPIQDLQPYTTKNLHDMGYTQYEKLFLPHGTDAKIPTVLFKSNIRRMLNENGYKIILNIGDQSSDFEGGYSEKGIKLPNYLYPFVPTFEALVSKKTYYTPVAGNIFSFANNMMEKNKHIEPVIEISSVNSNKM